MIKKNKKHNKKHFIEKKENDEENKLILNADKEEDDVEMDIETIILNMRIISEIKENDKLVANKKCLEIDTRYMQSIQRWWYQDGRQNALIKISKIVNNLFDFIDKTYGVNEKNKRPETFEEDKTHLFQRIHIILSNSIKGLENLKITYRNDIKTITKIDLIIEKINIKLEIMGSKIKLIA